MIASAAGVDSSTCIGRARVEIVDISSNENIAQGDMRCFCNVTSELRVSMAVWSHHPSRQLGRASARLDSNRHCLRDDGRDRVADLDHLHVLLAFRRRDCDRPDLPT